MNLFYFTPGDVYFAIELDNGTEVHCNADFTINKFYNGVKLNSLKGHTFDWDTETETDYEFTKEQFDQVEELLYNEIESIKERIAERNA